MGTEPEWIWSPAAFFGFGANSNFKISRQKGLQSGFKVQVFGLEQIQSLFFCDSAHLGLAVWHSGYKCRFYDDYNCKVIGSTPTQASLSHLWISCLFYMKCMTALA